MLIGIGGPTLSRFHTQMLTCAPKYMKFGKQGSLAASVAANYTTAFIHVVTLQDNMIVFTTEVLPRDLLAHTI